VWEVIASLSSGSDVSASVLEAAAAEAPTTNAGHAISWEQYGREIIRRETEQQATPDRAEWLRTEAARHPLEARALGALGTVTPPERVALETALGSTFHVSKPRPRTARTPPAAGALSSSSGTTSSLFRRANARRTGAENRTSRP
jgi:hypothetical protein